MRVSKGISKGGGGMKTVKQLLDGKGHEVASIQPGKSVFDAMDKLPRDVAVADLMTRQVTYVRPDQTNQDCMALITDKHVRHLPVLENERVIGLVSIGDLVKDTIAEQEFIIKQLENYIHG
jgi:CBS domain-containing protein